MSIHVHAFLCIKIFSIGTSLPRKLTRPSKVQKEREWMASDFRKPEGIQGVDKVLSLDNYEKLIWENPADLFMSKYGRSIFVSVISY